MDDFGYPGRPAGANGTFMMVMLVLHLSGCVKTAPDRDA
jgi:hypothetical protein